MSDDLKPVWHGKKPFKEERWYDMDEWLPALQALKQAEAMRGEPRNVTPPKPKQIEGAHQK